MSDIQSQTNTTETCRICLEEDSIDNMLHPCKCTEVLNMFIKDV